MRGLPFTVDDTTNFNGVERDKVPELVATVFEPPQGEAADPPKRQIGFLANRNLATTETPRDG